MENTHQQNNRVEVEGSVQVLVERKCQHCQTQTDQFWSKFKGAYYMYKFDDGVLKTTNNEHLNIQGFLKPLLPYGHIFHVDFESVSAEAASVLQWGEDIGLVQPNSKLWKRIQETDPMYVVALCCTGIPLHDTKLSILSYFAAFVLDDIIDNIHYETRTNAFNYKNLMNEVETFLSFLLLSNDDDKLEENKLNLIAKTVGEYSSTNVLPNLVGFCKTMIDIRKAATKTGRNPSYFLRAFSFYAKFAAMQSTQPNPPNQVELEYAYAKDHIQGLKLIYESTLLVHGVCPSQSLRENPRFATFVYLIAQHIGLVNDLLGLKKELTLGETQNMVLVRCRIMLANVINVKNLSTSTTTSSSYIQQAFDSLVNETNIIATRILELKDLLIDDLAGTDNEEIGIKCIDIAINTVNSHFQVYVNSARYLNNRGIYYVFPN